MDRPTLTKEQVNGIFDSRFIRLADLRYNGTMHYYSVSRKPLGQVPLLSEEEFKEMYPDAVTCIVIIKTPDAEPRLLLTKEFRYPIGQFLLSPPAGLLDKADLESENAVLSAAKREIEEETGLVLKDSDRLYKVNPLCFSSPGMTDEGNALACAVVEADKEISFNADHTESTERIGDYTLYTRDEALRMLKQGRDDEGIFYSIYTFVALLYFVSGLWKEA